MPLRQHLLLNTAETPINPATEDSLATAITRLDTIVTNLGNVITAINGGTQQTQIVDTLGNVSHSTEDIYGNHHIGTHIIQHNLIIQGNSTSANIAQGETWTGTSVGVTGGNLIVAIFYADQNCEITIEQSSDGGVNWVKDTQLYTTYVDNFSHPVSVVGTIARVTIKNIGIAATTTLSLVTQLQPVGLVLPRSLCKFTGCLKTAIRSIVDDNGFTAGNTPTGELRTSKLSLIAGAPFEGTILDDDYWSSSVANGGTVTVANGDVTLLTGTNAAGSAKVWSKKRGMLQPGMAMRYRGVVAMNNTGNASNRRRWGLAWGTTMPTYTDGVFFELNGTTFKIVTVKGGVEIEITSYNGNIGTNYVIDTQIRNWEIYYSQHELVFTISSVLLHRITIGDAHWANTMQYHIYMGNINSGSVINNAITCHEAGIVRFGELSGHSVYDYQSGLVAAKSLKTGVGLLEKIIISGVANNSRVILYDNTVASAPILFDSGAMGAQAIPFDIDFKQGIQFNTGLTLAITGATSTVTTIFI